MQRSRLTEITKLVPDDTRITKFWVTYLCTYVSTERIRTWIRTCKDSSSAQVHDAYIPVPASSTGKDIAHRTGYKVVPDQGSICPTALGLEMDREYNINAKAQR